MCTAFVEPWKNLMTRMCDLPPELVGMIFAKIPITSVRTVRSTCKLWDHLSKDWVLGKAAAPMQQFLGFMTMNSKVCSIRFHLCRKDKEDEDLLDLSIKQIDLLNHNKISKVFHCYGLLLCLGKDNSRLVVWNPYLGQTRCIKPSLNVRRGDMYALGYDNNNRNHKILKILDNYDAFRYEIYDFNFNSWRVLDVTPDWHIVYFQCGASLKGNTYFFARDELDPEGLGFLLCFDFTRERFGSHLPLPFDSYLDENVTLSCVREEQLAVLYQRRDSTEILEIWFTTKIEPNSVSWTKFLKVDMRPLTGFQFHSRYGSFFIDEEKKVAAVFDVDGDEATMTCRYHTSFIIGDDGYFKSVSLGKAPNLWEGGRWKYRYSRYITRPPLVCSSSYLPSLVQLN